MSALYAPKSAARIDEAAGLIEKAAKLLDSAGDRFVIAEIERVDGSEYINSTVAADLRALASRLEQ